MATVFSTRNISISDFEAWHERGELDLSPKFQRREVWNEKAKSFLIDTIVRGLPIPKLYMRQEQNPKSRRIHREIVDGQQRLRAVFDYLNDGFSILKIHNNDTRYAGKFFSDLDNDAKSEILKYEFVVDLLLDLSDKAVYDLFARLNTYSVTLNAQELRNAKYFGEFKTTAYSLANEFNTFWIENKIFSDKQILRMQEVEFASELLIAMMEGIKAKARATIDSFYKSNEEKFAKKEFFENRFREILDTVGEIFPEGLAETSFSQPRLFYPLFCAVFAAKYGMSSPTLSKFSTSKTNYSKMRIALESIEKILYKNRIIEEINQRQAAGESEEEILADFVATETNDDIPETLDQVKPVLSSDEDAFFRAFSIHWVHAEERKTMTKHIYKLLKEGIQG